jgi:CelD/BcsL family acetyltransferase involved in cellulose biosynthesis
MTTIEIDPVGDPRWQQLLDAVPHDVFHGSAWIGAVGHAYDFDVRAVIALDGDRVLAGMPFVRAEGVGGRRVVVGPFSDYCDPLIDDPCGWGALSAWIADQPDPVRIRSLRWRPPADDRTLTSAGLSHWHGLDVHGDPDEILSRMHPSARRAIRKAEASELEVVSGESLEDLRAFHEIHVEVRRSKYRLLAQPFGFFEAIWDNFVAEGQGELKLARLNGETVAGVLFLFHGGRQYYKFNASRSDQLDVRPNDAIVWTAIQDALEAGRSLIDFGLSDWDQAGLARYKAKFGAEAGEIASLTGGGPAEPPKVGSVFGSLTELLTDSSVPTDVTTRAGEMLYRWFV